MAKSFLESAPSEDEAEVIFEVPPGMSLKGVAKALEREGLVTSGSKFYWYGRLRKAEAKVRVGEYALARDMSPSEIMKVIMTGKSIERPITVQEGFNIYEIADLLEQQGLAKRHEFLALVRDRKFIRELIGADLPSLEGYLFPETYHITKYTGLKGLVRMMVLRFLTVYQAVPTHRMSRHQLVTLASIIEKETGAPEERPTISSVFHNRLKKGMRLQTDPTVIYGKFVATGRWDKNISKADLLTDNVYNTYTRGGLPFGPISNPGRQALVSAARPTESEFFFFVSRNDGTHNFSKDYKGHERAVMQFQLDRKARQGKSWRDLNKRKASPVKAQAGG
jgi:UPF0755 protein